MSDGANLEEQSCVRCGRRFHAVISKVCPKCTREIEVSQSTAIRAQHEKLRLFYREYDKL